MRLESQVSIAFTMLLAPIIIGIHYIQDIIKFFYDNQPVSNGVFTIILAVSILIISNLRNIKNRRYTRNEIAKTYRDCVSILQSAMDNKVDHTATLCKIQSKCKEIVERASIRSHLLDSKEIDSYNDQYTMVTNALNRKAENYERQWTRRILQVIQ